MDWTGIGGTVLVVMGACSSMAGIVFGLLPILPGPPVAMLGPVLVVAGFQIMREPMSGWSWAMLAVVLLLGVVVTAIDLFSPILGKKLGGTGRGAMVGAYFGLMIALLFSVHIGGIGAATSLVTAGLTLVASAIAALLLLFAGPMLGGMVGDLVGKPAVVHHDPDFPTPPMSQLLWESLGAGVAQCVGLLITTGTKVIYGVLATAACAVLIIGWIW